MIQHDTRVLFNDVFDQGNGIAFYSIDKHAWEIIGLELLAYESII